MIKATDLRIGNWYVNQWGEYLQVDPDLFGADNLESYPIPICINNEILEKCGFEKTESKSYRTGKEVVFYVYSKDGLVYNTIQGLWWLFGRIIPNQPQYLHQIQNLHHSLNNKELEFKP